MNPEVKKYAIVGGALVIAVVGGVWAYKRFENSGAAAAADQSNQDTLAYEMEQLAAGSGYGSFSGSSFAPQTTFGSESTQQTLAQEIASLEQIFNPAPAAPAAPASPASPVSPVTPAPTPAPVLPVPPSERRLAQTEVPTFAHEGVTIA